MFYYIKYTFLGLFRGGRSYAIIRTSEADAPAPMTPRWHPGDAVLAAAAARQTGLKAAQVGAASLARRAGRPERSGEAPHAAAGADRPRMAKRDATWEAQLAKVEVYKRRHGDCNVPWRWAKDPPLGLWVKKQRIFKKALDRSEPSKRMTAARAAKLDAIGFA